MDVSHKNSVEYNFPIQHQKETDHLVSILDDTDQKFIHLKNKAHDQFDKRMSRLRVIKVKIKMLKLEEKFLNAFIYGNDKQQGAIHCLGICLTTLRERKDFIKKAENQTTPIQKIKPVLILSRKIVALKAEVACYNQVLEEHQNSNLVKLAYVEHKNKLNRITTEIADLEANYYDRIKNSTLTIRWNKIKYNHGAIANLLFLRQKSLLSKKTTNLEKNKKDFDYDRKINGITVDIEYQDAFNFDDAYKEGLTILKAIAVLKEDIILAQNENNCFSYTQHKKSYLHLKEYTREFIKDVLNPWLSELPAKIAYYKKEKNTIRENLIFFRKNLSEFFQ